MEGQPLSTGAVEALRRAGKRRIAKHVERIREADREAAEADRKGKLGDHRRATLKALDNIQALVRLGVPLEEVPSVVYPAKEDATDG